MTETQEYNCRVCGFPSPVPIWDGEHTDYDICPACRCQAGDDDTTIEIDRAYRKEWVDNGMKWWDEDEAPPSNWNPEEQMKIIPEKWL